MTTGNREVVLQSLFPEPVGFFKLNRALTDVENSFLVNQTTRGNIGNLTSVDNYILNNPALSSLRSFLQECVDAYLRIVYAPKNEITLRFTQSWTNYTKKTQHHHTHSHPNSFISGVFYVNADKDTDKIFFFSGKQFLISLTPIEHNIFNSKDWFFPVNTGDLILFPSSLVHAVDTVTTDSTRISLAFNTFPVGILGDNQGLTELKL
jgi:uncharacterized protein (TIGR02466 family)